MKGKGLLKVTGILMIIGGGAMTIVGIIAVLGISALAALAEGLGATTNVGLLTVGAILGLASALFELYAGIAGVKNCAKPEKAGVCLTLGVLVAVFTIAGNIFNVIGGGTLNVLGLGVGLVVPALYIIGASMNRQTA